MKQQQWLFENSKKVLNDRFALLPHQRFLKISSAPIRRNLQKAPVTTAFRAFCKGTENWVFHPKTTRRKCSAGQRAPSSQRKSWKPCAKLIEKAGTLWWACPTPAVSGDVARVRSAPFVEELHAHLHRCRNILLLLHTSTDLGSFSEWVSFSNMLFVFSIWNERVVTVFKCFLLKDICNAQPGLFDLELYFSVLINVLSGGVLC